VKLVVSRAAVRDLARLREFLADKNPAAAQRAIARCRSNRFSFGLP
jgi:plasmid stabilization system protein ParE